MLKPRDGILWAHPTLNAKGLTEVSPLHMKVVAGARLLEIVDLYTAPFRLAI